MRSVKAGTEFPDAAGPLVPAAILLRLAATPLDDATEPLSRTTATFDEGTTPPVCATLPRRYTGAG